MEIILAILALNFIIFIHEFGHFFMAKLFKVKIITFSIGLGKKLIKKRIFGTEFCISIFPLGGYCKLKGEDSLNKAFSEKLEYIPYEKNSIFSIHPFKRILISLAGPLANLLFAIFIFSFMYMTSYVYYDYENKIFVVNKHSAQKTGLQNEDRIIKVEGVKTESFLDIQEELLNNNSKSDVNLTVLRDGKEKSFKVKWEEDGDRKVIGIMPYINLIVDEIGDKEMIAGLKKGDLIKEVNSVEVKNANDFLEEIKKCKYKYKIKFIRNGKLMEKELLLNYTKEGEYYSNIIFKKKKFTRDATPFLNSFNRGIKKTSRILEKITLIFLDIFKGSVKPTDAVSGPIKITYYVSQNIKNNSNTFFTNEIINFLELLGRLSIAIFFGNILPIPPLDGGHITLYLIELFSTKKLKTKYIKLYYTIAITIILFLFSLAFLSDILFIGKIT